MLNAHNPVVNTRSFRVWFSILFLILFTRLLSIAAEETLPVPQDDIDWAKEHKFWSFSVPQRQARPNVQNQRWPNRPLDFFVLAKLEEHQLEPSPESDRATLIRRLSFDLTGLPPTAKEVKAFVDDHRADAYERVVDRLMASPRFGEHLASLWLPLARYAEDQAHQVGSDTKFFYPNAHLYRQWVIDSFNHDLPYDDFLKFQLAADKFAAGDKQVAALGFIGLGPKYYNRGRLDVMADEWEDRVDTVSRTMLGLTVACARCHNHKFEPVTMRDYYSMAGVFASTKMVNKTADGKAEKDVGADKMDPQTLHMVEDGDAKNINVFLRGNVERKGPVVERHFLQILSQGEPKPYTEGSGRKELAEAIACRNNPLAARVMVNRIWSSYFGKPLVATPSNFGHSGSLPTHPELLDDLAVRFMDGGWLMKSLIREIVTSSTYRQTATASTRHQKLDPENRWLGHMNRRRLSIEQWRDSVLFTAGNLKLEGGKSLELDDPVNLRRTVFSRVSRLKLNDVFMQFDYPDANVHAENRSITSTPLQKLFLLNNPFVLSEAKTLAEKLRTGSKSNSANIREAYHQLFGRGPTQIELDLDTNYLAGRAKPGTDRWAQFAQTLLISNEMWYLD